TGDALGLVAQVIAALVRHDYAIASRDQRRNLMPPPVPEFWKAVQQQHKPAVFRPRRDDMQRDAVGLDLMMFQRDAVQHIHSYSRRFVPAPRRFCTRSLGMLPSVTA